MAIDFSTNTDDWWKTTFERYITGGNAFQTIASGGETAIRSHFQNCLPMEDYPDKKLEVTQNECIITATHPRSGPFELRANKWTGDWEFKWIN